MEGAHGRALRAEGVNRNFPRGRVPAIGEGEVEEVDKAQLQNVRMQWRGVFGSLDR